MAQGLCFLCDKPYNKGHKCGFKEPQLFTIEVCADDESEEDKDDSIGNLEKKMGQCLYFFTSINRR